MAPTAIKIEERDGVAVVTINRPEKLNALNGAVIEELHEAFSEIKENNAVRVVILTGAGEKAFIAGADIGELAACNPDAAWKNSQRGQELTRLIDTLGKPVIAAINGFALGGGCELAMACTFRIASENAKLGQPEVKLGLTPGYGGTQRLPRLVGRGRALELLLTGDPIDAAEALRIGLVNRVVKKETLMADAEAIARKIASVGPVAVQYTLHLVDNGLDLPLEAALDQESSYFSKCFATQDMREGTQAFLEKRAAKFSGI